MIQHLPANESIIMSSPPSSLSPQVVSPHFGTLADVFHHTVLAQVLTQLRPAEYWESHAGAALHEESGEVPAARQHGIQTFYRLAAQVPEMRASAYARALAGQSQARVPGSALLARMILGDRVRRLLLCDTDAACLQTIQKQLPAAAAGWKALPAESLECVQDDGVTVLRGAGMLLAESWMSSVLAYIDAEDMLAATAADISPLELACELGNRGMATLLTYGFADEAERAAGREAQNKTLTKNRIGNRALRWEGCLKAAGGSVATRWGFGVLALNLSPQIVEGVERDLRALEAAYGDVTMEGAGGAVTGAWVYGRSAGV